MLWVGCPPVAKTLAACLPNQKQAVELVLWLIQRLVLVVSVLVLPQSHRQVVVLW